MSDIPRNPGEAAAYANGRADQRESDAKVIAALRERERAIIDHTWGYACGDGSVPSTKIQDKIIAAIEQEAGG